MSVDIFKSSMSRPNSTNSESTRVRVSRETSSERVQSNRPPDQRTRHLNESPVESPTGTPPVAPRAKNELYKSIIGLETSTHPMLPVTTTVSKPASSNTESMIRQPQQQNLDQDLVVATTRTTTTTGTDPPSPPQASRKRGSPSPPDPQFTRTATAVMMAHQHAQRSPERERILTESTDGGTALIRMEKSQTTPPAALQLNGNNLRVHGGLVQQQSTRRRRFMSYSEHLPISPLAMSNLIAPNPSMYGLPTSSFTETYDTKLVRLSILVEQQHRIEVNWFWEQGSSVLFDAISSTLQPVRNHNQQQQRFSSTSSSSPSIDTGGSGSSIRGLPLHPFQKQEEYTEEVVSLNELSSSASSEFDTQLLEQKLASSTLHGSGMPQSIAINKKS